MKKNFFIFTMLVLCLFYTSAIASIKIPITTADALDFVSVDLPTPSVTVETEPEGGLLFRLESMEKLPLRDKEQYKKGVYDYDFVERELHLIEERKEEPFAILVTGEERLRINLKTSSSKYTRLSLKFEPLWSNLSFLYTLSDGTECTFDMHGNLMEYSFSSKGYNVRVCFDSFSMMNSCSIYSSDLSLEYDASGKLERIFFTDQDNQTYSYIDNIWMNAQYEECDQPVGFSTKKLPELLFCSKKNAALAAVRKETFLASFPEPSMVAGMNLKNVLPPPEVIENTDEQGNLWIMVTGLSKWGFSTYYAIEYKDEYTASLHYHVGEPDTLTVFVPADMVTSWNGEIQLQSLYDSIRGFLTYERHATNCLSFHYVIPNAQYILALGDSPVLVSVEYSAGDESVYQYLWKSLK